MLAPQEQAFILLLVDIPKYVYSQFVKFWQASTIDGTYPIPFSTIDLYFGESFIYLIAPEIGNFVFIEILNFENV